MWFMNSAFYINVDPVIFRIGPLAVGWYGMMVALAVVTVVSWIVWENSKSHKFSFDSLYMAAIIGIVSGIVFSKLLHVIDQWQYYWQNPSRIISGEGLTIWGAVLGATIGVWLYSKIGKHFKFGVFGDMIAPGIILSQAIGRIGCTLNGCCYGLESDAWCSIIYTDPHSYGPIGIPVLPTQVFEIGYDLLVFAILVFLRKKLKPDGALFTVYFALYGAWRFGIEFLRQGTPFLFGMHQAQLIGLIVMLITISIIIFKVRWKKPGDEPAAAVETPAKPEDEPKKDL
jgi:phosphatidylglycerol:prolipoprotein diacylglycerol transferase